MKYGGEEKAIEKIERLKSYLSDGLPRYQDVLEQQGKEIPIERSWNNGKPNFHSIK